MFNNTLKQNLIVLELISTEKCSIFFSTQCTLPKVSSCCHPGKALKRQVAFLFDFEEIEHTTVLGLTLQDIIKDAKHKLRPWELDKKRKIRGLKRAVVPNLGYSQIYCYYRVLPEHLEGPPIGLAYE